MNERELPKQLSTEQAIEFAKSEAWKNLTDQQKVAFQLYQEKLCMPFGVFHGAVESALGRPVWTHEFIGVDKLRDEFEGKCKKPSLEDIISLLPKDREIITVVTT